MGAIIAGGRATRMGGVNKPLKWAGNQPLILHAYQRMEPQASGIIVNANRDQREISALVPSGTAIVEDDPEFAGRGPLVGLLACLAHARSNDFKFLATAAADTPFFPADLIDQLRAPIGDGAIRIARHDGWRHPLFGLWPTSLMENLETFLYSHETNKVMAFAKRHDLIEVDIEAKGSPFFNVNTPNDLAQADEMLQKMRS